MDTHARATTLLKYRFGGFSEARAHVRDHEGRPLFFYRDEKLRLLPFAPVCLEFSFDDGTSARLLHGWALDALEGTGTWIELRDTRPVGSGIEHPRKGRRLGCDLPVEVRTQDRIATGHLLDVSEGGARIAGIAGLAPDAAVELRLLSGDRLTFHDLSFGFVAWTDGESLGVQFDPKDTVGRSAVTRMLREAAADWRRAWEAVHPTSCCNGRGAFHPEPPQLRREEDAAGQVAL